MEKTNKELIVKEQGQELAKVLTPEVIKKYICPTATQQEIMMFLQIAKMYQLNPFKREIYLVKYGDNPAQNVVGYEVYLKRAERTGEWSGMKVWTEGIIPQLTAKIEINKKGWDKPFYHEVDYSEYVQHKKDGEITRFWKEKPKTMLKKVVVSQAFRMAFPDEFGGMPYTMEEMPIEIEKLPTEEVKIEEHIKKETQQETSDDRKNLEHQTVKYISDKQAKRLYAITQSLSVPNEVVKAYLQEKYHIAHSKDITMDIYDEVVKWVEDYGAKNQPPKE